MCFYSSGRSEPEPSKEVRMRVHKGSPGSDSRDSAATQSIYRFFSCHDVALGPSQDDRFINTQTAGPCAVIKN